MENEGQEVSTPEQSIDDFIGEQLDTPQDEPQGDVAPVDDEPTTDIEPAAPDDEPESVEAKDTQDKPDSVDDEPDGEPDDSQAVTAPASMSAKDREAFYAMPPDSQKWLSDRMQEQESSFTKKTMELADQRKTYDKLEQIIAPRRQQLAMDGLDDSSAIGQLFVLSDFAKNDPVGFTRYLFNQRGIPLSAINESGGGNNAPADPQLQAMMSEIHGLKNSISQQQSQAQDVENHSVITAIEDFAQDKAFPFYGELEADMIPLVASFRQSQPGLSNKDYLAKAYKAALAGNDEVSGKIAADNKAKTEAARIAKAKKDAAKAKKSAGTKVRGGALPTATGAAKGVDDFIGALVDERMTA